MTERHSLLDDQCRFHLESSIVKFTLLQLIVLKSLTAAMALTLARFVRSLAFKCKTRHYIPSGRSCPITPQEVAWKSCWQSLTPTSLIKSFRIDKIPGLFKASNNMSSVSVVKPIINFYLGSDKREVLLCFCRRCSWWKYLRLYKAEVPYYGIVVVWVEGLKVMLWNGPGGRFAMANRKVISTKNHLLLTSLRLRDAKK